MTTVDNIFNRSEREEAELLITELQILLDKAISDDTRYMADYYAFKIDLLRMKLVDLEKKITSK